MGASIAGILVRLDPVQLVIFTAPGEDLALFSRPVDHFSRSVLETIAAGGVVASLGASTASNVRRLRLHDTNGNLIFDERIPVYLT